jgi:biopolymer transport protein ExbB
MNAHLERLWSFFELGGPVTWAILLFSLLLWTLILERYWYFLVMLPAERKQVVKRWRQVGRHATRLAQRERASLVAGHAHRARRYLLPIRTLTGALPLLGLMGTVSGMIEAFDVMTVFGTGNVRGMADGISRALFTTMAGLVTALSGLYFSANLDSRARVEERRMQHLLK